MGSPASDPHLVLPGAAAALPELGVEPHELPGQVVDAGVQHAVLAVLPVEVLLVAQPLLLATDHRVRPEEEEEEEKK